MTSDELHDCIRRLNRNKSAGIDGVLSEMIKDGGEVLHSCLLVNLMVVSHFQKQLSVGLITAVYKSGDKSDMSNYRGITKGAVIAKLFTMLLDHRIGLRMKALKPTGKQDSGRIFAQQITSLCRSL